jgi:hypothetical protein
VPFIGSEAREWRRLGSNRRRLGGASRRDSFSFDSALRGEGKRRGRAGRGSGRVGEVIRRPEACGTGGTVATGGIGGGDSLTFGRSKEKRERAELGRTEEVGRLGCVGQ